MSTPELAGLWIPGPLPGLNELIDAAKGSGGRGAGYARLKREWTEAVWAYAKQARLPAFPRRVVLEFTWHERDRRRDPDNVAAGGRKLVLDGLVVAGVLKGDGWRYVQSWTDRFYVNPDRPGVGVQIHHFGGAVLMD
jgi:hypothetical protein